MKCIRCRGEMTPANRALPRGSDLPPQPPEPRDPVPHRRVQMLRCDTPAYHHAAAGPSPGTIPRDVGRSPGK